MRRTTRTLVVMIAAAALASNGAATAAAASSGFEKLKTLVGSWDGKDSQGNAVRTTYKLVSNGSALEEKIQESQDMDMVSIYHQDGAKVLMTHYCGMNNQPRMRADGLSSDGKALAFAFVDVTNLADKEAPHMRSVSFTFQDADHFTQEWTLRDHGKETKEVFTFQRGK